MYVYCIDICIILIEFCFALMDMAFYSIAIRLPGTVPVDIFGQYKKKKFSINVSNICCLFPVSSTVGFRASVLEKWRVKVLP